MRWKRNDFKKYIERNGKTFEFYGAYYYRSEAQKKGKALKNMGRAEKYKVLKSSKSDIVLGERDVFGLYIY